MARVGVIAFLLVAVAAAGILAGCGDRIGPPAPYELRTGAGAPALNATPPVPHPDRITVVGGETLYGVSRRYGVPLRAIIDANNLRPPFLLLAGTSLVLPQVATHVVRPGDTLTSVARDNGVDVSTLARTNHLAPPYVIRTGEALILPAPVATAQAGAGPAPPPVAAAPVATVAMAPLTAPPPRVAVVPFAPPPPLAARPGKAARPTVAATPAPAPLPVPTPMPPAKPAEATAPPPPLKVSDQGFIWPVHGRIVAAYGAGPQGTHNDGIDIAAREGTPVLAADSGEVAYAGNELRGYGNLILIKHPNGFITAYAHNETLLVQRGEHVRRGQIIARVGATGAVSQPQLHFEIRRGVRALDPDAYLPAQTAAARP
ncbi:MAG TPA: LysM peptidoglycan-binding domain-containing M23 family metallopeptidase [Stellaceae bacterium]|nr:LysM peptidoglycan-binding domain-containing M23 family metallopeptidase [Stellaceae bacterium]